MWMTRFEECPVNACGRARARPRAFEGPDLQVAVVDALMGTLLLFDTIYVFFFFFSIYIDMMILLD